MQKLAEIIRFIRFLFIPLHRIKTDKNMIESPPSIEKKFYIKALMGETPEEANDLVDKINEKYEYWDKVKYKPLPQGYTTQLLWSHVKASRALGSKTVWPKYKIKLFVTNKMQRMCHDFDMIFGSFWESNTTPLENEKMRYLANSLMEEAIFSSQMEGAATTRAVAKEMLKNGMSPRDKSQQMISNNYKTICYIVEHKDEPLTPENIRLIHSLMTEKTLKNNDDVGRFRSEYDEVVVENQLTGEVVHTPPDASEIPDFINDLCSFFNNGNKKIFIHPIIRGIIIHFMVAYMHPFVDGNGRTARALFYWYMLKEKYWLTEYMSISRVIANSKRSYEDAFLYTESDGYDIGYFVAYNLRVLELSFRQLKSYIEKKQREKQIANTFIIINKNINERQAQIIHHLIEHPQSVITVKEIQNKFLITPMTARHDLVDLVNKKYLTEISINNRKKGYIKSDNFDELTTK